MSLPRVDLQQRPEDPAARREIAHALDTALRGVGFCYLHHTGVEPRVIKAAFTASRAFHALDLAAKQALSINEYHRGYIASRSSTIRSSSVAEVTRPNLSDSLMLMHEVREDDPDFGRPLNGANQWPDVPEFRPTIERYLEHMRALARYVTRLIAVALDLPQEHFDRAFAKPTEWLRLLRYVPLPSEHNQASRGPGDETRAQTQFSAAPHTDYGFITLLAQDDLGGLEVRDAAGRWHAAPPIADTFILNVADMLERWTDGRWPSSAHRVRNFASVDRYAIPYFYDPHIDTVVERLPSVAARTARGPVVFGDYVLERLDRNYAYRQNSSPDPSA